MKIIGYLCLILPLFCSSQSKKPDEKKTEQYIDAAYDFQVLTISARDARFALFEGKEKGSVIISGKDIYKILEVEDLMIYSYGVIFVSTVSLSVNSKEELQQKIITEYREGRSFVSLLKKYDTEKNSKAANITAAGGYLENSCENEIKQHKPGEIFIADDKDGHFKVILINKAPFTEKAIKAKYVVYK